MDTLADYNAWKAKQQQNSVGAANVVINSVDATPDEVAGEINLANEFGKVTGNPVPPRPMVKEFKNVFQAKIEEQKNKTILSASPRLTEWLRNPDNASVARDDLANLSWWEMPFGAASNAIGRGVRRAPMGYNQFMADQSAQRLQDAQRSAGDILSEESAIRNAKGEKIADRVIPGPFDVAAAGWRYGASRLSSMLGWDETQTAQQYEQRVGEISKRISEIPMSPAASRFRDAALSGEAQGDAWQQVTDFFQKFADDPAGGMAFLGETAVESMPAIAAATAVTLTTRNPALGAAAMGGTSYAQERYTSPADFFKEKGIDISTPEGARAVISNPGLMAEAAQRGVIRGSIIGLLDGLSGGLAGKELAASPLGNMVLQSISQAVMGGAGEAAAQYATGGRVDMREVIVEALAEFVTAPAEVVGVGGRKFIEMQRAAKEAAAQRALLDQVSAQAQASALRNRLPDSFRDFVSRATENGAAENVYIPAQEFVQYFQGLGFDPFEMVDEFDGVTRDDLETALAGGGDLQIPLATYAAKMAGSEHDAFMLDNMRFDPNGMTASEAALFNENRDEIMQQMWEEAEAVRVEAELRKPVEQEIYDTMVSRLRTAGRATDVATNEAMLYQAFYRVMAERTGNTIDDLLRRYPLPEVRGSIPEGMQFKSVDELTRTLAEARNRRAAGLEKKGPTLLEWISDYGGMNDPGGELRARNADIIRRGRGKKTLKLARESGGAALFGSDKGGKKYGVDDVARAAIEAGYLADNPIANEYRAAMTEGREVPDIGRALFEAIDDELRGNPSYAGDAGMSAEEASALDSIEEYLSSLGVSLNDSDEEIRAAIEGARQYAQRATIDVDGIELPLNPDGTVTLYHGTTSEAAAKIVASKMLKSAAEPSVYLTTQRDAGTGYGDGTVVAVDVLPSSLRLDDEFGDGRADFAIDKKIIAVRRARIVGDGETRHLLFQRNETDARGVIQFTPDGQSIIRLFETANLSTMLHESGHFFLTVMQDMARRDAANAPKFSLPENMEIVEKGDGLHKRLRLKDVKENDGPDAVDGSLGTQGITFWEEDGRINIAGSYLPSSVRGQGRGKALYTAMAEYASSVGKTLYSDFDVSSDALKMYDMLKAAGYDVQRSVSFREGSDSGYSGKYIGGSDEEGNKTDGFTIKVLPKPVAPTGTVAADFEAIKGWWRENAAAVAADARRAMPDVAVTKEDVIAALDNGTTGDAMKDGAIDVGMQEQFARGFEAYLMEGKAPSVELRSVFAKFGAWLISIYQRLAGLNVTVSDDIRAVMDRMLATDEEIARAKQEAGETGPIFATGEQMGLTPEEYAAFKKLRSQAEDEAKARLLREAMTPVKREKEKWYRDEREKVKEEVSREVNAYRYYRAIEWMGNRRWLGEGQPVDMPDMRLSKDILVERYGAGVLDTLPRGKQTVYAVKGGMDPDEAAGWFGFGSGDEMIRAMEQAPKRNEAIEAETDRVMRERHGDPLNDGSIEAEALDAIHTDKKAQWLAAELKAVIEVAGTGVGMTAKEAREAAKQTLARTRVRDAMNANRFLAAERKAAEEAARLGAQLARDKVWLDAAKRKIATSARAAVRGDASPEAAAKAIEDYNARFETTTSTFTVADQQRTAKSGKQFTIPGGERTTTSYGYNDQVARFIDAKRRQLLNHALYMEARKVADEVEKAERYVAKLGKATTRERIAGAGRRENARIDYLGAIDELLERYDFRKMSGRAEDRRGALAAFIEGMKAAGRENEIAIPEKVLTDAARKPYKTIPVEELRGVIDSLKNLEHVATRWNDLIDAKHKKALEDAVNEVAEAFEENVRKRPPGRVGSRGEAFRNSSRQFFDLVLNATTLLREIDGFKDMGAAYRNIKAPIDEAMTRLIARKEKAASDLEALYSVYSKEERRRMAVREYVPALGYALSKWERIAVALNTGNAGNVQRLTDPGIRGALTEPQVAAVLATLDARDADFVQSVWDYVASFKDDIAARERRTTGIEPAWVEPSPVTIAGKTLKGGYYPLKYDPRLSSLARDDETALQAQSLQAGRFGKAQTRNGHLKERAQASGRAVELDMSVLHRHVNQVIYDLELSEPVTNSWRILQNSRIRSAFVDAGKQADFDALEIWLQDVGNGELRSADLVGRMARTMKSNFTAAKLAFNLVTVAMQITGFAQSMVIVGKKNMAVGIMKTAARPIEISREVAAKSAFMATRETTFNKDIYDFYSDPRTGPVASRWGDIKREIIGPLSFWLMTKTQWHLVDVPTWIAGYEQGLRKFGNDETKAVAHADDIVKRAQASGLFSDRSAVERGSVSRTARQNDVVRLFTALGSYMFAKFNAAYERSAVAGRTIREEGVSMRSAQEALSWTLDMAFLFMLETVVTAMIKGQLPDGDDEDDDGWMKWLAKQTAFSVMGTVPFVRDVAGPLQGFDGGGAYGAITKELAAPFTQAGQGEIDRSLVKSIINATGLATGIPATQINRAVDAAMREADGEDVSPLEYILGRSKK